MANIISSLRNNNNLPPIRALWSLVVSDILKCRKKPDSYSQFFTPIDTNGLVKYKPSASNCIQSNLPPVTLYIGTTTSPTYASSSANIASGVGVVTVYLNTSTNIITAFQTLSALVLFNAADIFATAYLNSVAGVGTQKNAAGNSLIDQPIFFIESGLAWYEARFNPGDLKYTDSAFFDHPIWQNPNVVPLIELECRFTENVINGHPVTMHGLGLSYADRLKIVQDRYQAAGVDRPLNWCLNISTLGQSQTSGTPTAWGPYAWFEDPDDMIASTTLGISTPGPWGTGGIAVWAELATLFYTGLKAGLDQYGIPYPLWMMDDYEPAAESVGNIFFGDSHANNGKQSYLDLVADNRWDTVLFDGRRTLKQFFDDYTALDGSAINRSAIGSSSELFLASLYALTDRSALLANMFTSVSRAVRDWMLYNIHVQPAKQVFGNGITCVAYNQHTATRENPLWDYRPKETPVDFNSGQWLDGNHLTLGSGMPIVDVYSDNPSQGTSLGLSDYYSVKNITGVTSTTPNESQFREMAFNYCELATRQLIGSSQPGKKNCIWHSFSHYQDVNNDPGKIILDSSHWPGGITVPITIDYQLEIFRRYAKVAMEGKGAIDYINCFEAWGPASDTGIPVRFQDAYSFWDNIIQRLPNLGYKSNM